jgi:hypothetical protein
MAVRVRRPFFCPGRDNKFDGLVSWLRSGCREKGGRRSATTSSGSAGLVENKLLEVKLHSDVIVSLIYEVGLIP